MCAKYVDKENDWLKNAYEDYTNGNFDRAIKIYKENFNLTKTIDVPSSFDPNSIQLMFSIILAATNTPTELLMAVKYLEDLKIKIEKPFPPIYYFLGFVYFKLYRFDYAEEAIKQCLTQLNKQILFDVYFIPGTTNKISETTRDGLVKAVIELKHKCQSWILPNAICNLMNCQNYTKQFSANKNIYFGDPAYTGMVNIHCNNEDFSPQVLKYHRKCWEFLKKHMHIKSESNAIGMQYKFEGEGLDLNLRIAKIELLGKNGEVEYSFGESNPNVHNSKGTFTGTVKRNIKSLRRPHLINNKISSNINDKAPVFDSLNENTCNTLKHECCKLKLYVSKLRHNIDNSHHNLSVLANEKNSTIANLQIEIENYKNLISKANDTRKREIEELSHRFAHEKDQIILQFEEERLSLLKSLKYYKTQVEEREKVNEVMKKNESLSQDLEKMEIQLNIKDFKYEALKSNHLEIKKVLLQKCLYWYYCSNRTFMANCNEQCTLTLDVINCIQEEFQKIDFQQKATAFCDFNEISQRWNKASRTWQKMIESCDELYMLLNHELESTEDIDEINDVYLPPYVIPPYPKETLREIVRNMIYVYKSELGHEDEERSYVQPLSPEVIYNNNYEFNIPQVSKNSEKVMKREEEKQITDTYTAKNWNLDRLIAVLRKEYSGFMEFDLCKCVKKIRSDNNGSLSGLTISTIVNTAGEILTKQQNHYLLHYNSKSIKNETPKKKEVFHPKKKLVNSKTSERTKNKKRESRFARTTTTNYTLPPAPGKSPWGVIPEIKDIWIKESEESECIICMEILKTKKKPTYTLLCQHTFHKECLKTWFQQNQSCPTCRVHSTLDDDFPPLPA